MQRHRIASCIFVLVAGLGCGPASFPADVETESSTQGDGDGDGDGVPAWCSTELAAEIEPMIVDLQTIVDGTVAYFQAEHPAEDPSLPLHRCPHPIGAPLGGEAAFTPDIGFNCNAAPDCKCAPALGGGGVGIYSLELWTQNSVWQGVGFSKNGPHAFHYNVIVTNDTSGYGGCDFTARAVGDFDDDGLFSTYERRGTIDENGVNLEPLFMDLVDE
jgi:hypothetical protein